MLNLIFGPIMGLVGNIFGGVNDHFKAKRELKAAELATKLRILEADSTHDINWELLWAKQAENSWKDEWWTIVVSLPLVMAFVPELVPYVQAGFAAIATTPDWYQGLVMIAFGASFGVRIVPKGVNALKAMLGK